MRGSMVRFFIFLMTAIYLVDAYQYFLFVNGASDYVMTIAPLTPIKTYLMFQDFPLDRKLYDLLMVQKGAMGLTELTPMTQEIIKEVLAQGREFGQMSIPFTELTILRGQFYRLFTPALLHANLLHILFNLLWFLALGSMIEKRAGARKLLVLILIVGIAANVAQFIATGPLFLGVSGVVCGLAGFIYIRTKRAPWEGYPLSNSGIGLLFIYIVFLTLIEIFG
ncbi:MAG: rhomboid family intramembrane serine protease, partial [Chlamydiae bacterium]|nr:rhomboid family intramembrane serine protease [Chlamydiota bacterium]